MANNQNNQGRRPNNASEEAAKVEAAKETLAAEDAKVIPAPSQEPEEAPKEEEVPSKDQIKVETVGNISLVSPFTGKDFPHDKAVIANKNDPFVVDQLKKGQLKEV